MDTLGLTIYEYADKVLFNYCRLKGYSQTNTYGVYRSNLFVILSGLPKLEKSSILEIQDFAATYKNDSTRKNICVVIRWLWKYVFNSEIDWRLLPYPKYKKKVQPIYSYDEAMAILSNLENEKQEAIVGLMIDAGARIGEPCSIFLTDYFPKERKIILRSNKGDEDRIIFISENVLTLINNYQSKWYKPTVKYLFEGLNKGEPYTQASIRAFFKRACFRANVEYKKVHALRRFNITWSVENGVPLSVTALKVGHKTTRTIEKSYIIHSPTFLKSVQSPMTNINLQKLISA